MVSSVLPFASIPGPPPKFLVGELSRFRKSLPWDVCASYAATYGPLTRITVLGKSIVVLNGPEVILDVLDRKASAIHKDSPRPALLPISTDSNAFMSPGGAHWEKRRLALPQLHAGFGPWLARRLPGMHAFIKDRLASWSREENAWDAHEKFFRLTFDVFSVAMAGRELGDAAYRCFQELGDLGDRRLLWKLPFGRPWGREGGELQQRWLGFFRDVLAETRQSPEQSDNLIAFQLKAGWDRSDEDFVTDIANSYFSGCFAASATLVGALYDLTRHPEERTRVMAAARSLDERGGLSDVNTLMEDQSLDYLLREEFRLRPPVAFFQRRVNHDADVELGGYTVPAGTILFIRSSALHVDKRHWGDDAGEFRPSRWANGVTEQNPYGSGYFFPFGRGPRACAGDIFSLAYLKLVLGAVLARYRPEIGLGQGFKPELYFAVWRVRGLKASLPPLDH